MGMFLAVIILVAAAALLIGAVVFGFVRNNRTRGLENTAANADVPSQKR